MRAIVWIRMLPIAAFTLTLTAGCNQFHSVNVYMTETQAVAACGDDEVVIIWFGKLGVLYLRRGDYRWGGGGDQGDHDFKFGCRSDMERIGITCGRNNNATPD